MASKLLLCLTAIVATSMLAVPYAVSFLRRRKEACKESSPADTPIKETLEVDNDDYNEEEEDEDDVVLVTVLPRKFPQPLKLQEIDTVHSDQAPATAPAPTSPKPKEDAPNDNIHLNVTPAADNTTEPLHPATVDLPVASAHPTTPVSRKLSTPVAALVPVNQTTPAVASLKLAAQAARSPQALTPTAPAAPKPLSPAHLTRAVPFTTRFMLEVGVFGDLVMGGTSTRQLAATWHRLSLKPFYDALPKVAPAGAVMGDVVEYNFLHTYDTNGHSSCRFTFIAHHWVTACAEYDPNVSYEQDLKDAIAAALKPAAA